MNGYVGDCRKQQQELRTAAAELAEVMRTAADNLRGDTFDAATSLGPRVDEIHRRYDDLVADIDFRIRQYGSSPAAQLNETPSLLALGRAIDSLADLKQQAELFDRQRQSALEVLREVQRIRHIHDSGFAPIAELQQRADSLTNEIARENAPLTVSETTVELASGRHPWCLLVDLLKQPNNLADEEWSNRVDAIGSKFGRSIAVAVMRRRLTIKPDETDQVSESATDPLLPQSKSPGESSSVHTQQAVSPATFDSHSGDDDLARMAEDVQQLVGREREAGLGRITCELVARNRYALAYHLSESTGQTGTGHSASLTPRIVRILAWGDALQYPENDVASLLKTELDGLGLEGLAGDAETSKATRLYLTAGLLRPALLAPATEAGSILRASKIESGLVQFHNFCRRVASFADHGQPLDPLIFKTMGDGSTRASGIAELLSDIEDWSSTVEIEPIRYHSATHCFLRSHWSVSVRGSRRASDFSLWRSWQHIANELHGVMACVSENRVEELPHVRRVVHRLTSGGEGPSPIRQMHLVLADEDHLSTETANGMRDYVRRVLGFARRWIALHTSLVPEQSSPVPGSADHARELNRAVELRGEILNRAGDVTRELKQLATAESDTFVQAAADYCRRVVGSLCEFFDPDIPWTGDEASPEELMHGELLRLTEIPLDDDWHPTAESNKVENAILDLLVRGKPNWESAFETHLDRQNYTAAGRLLSLDVWPSNQKREDLQSMCTRHLHMARLELKRRADETSNLLTEHFKLQLIDDASQMEIQNQLDVLKAVLSHTTHVRQCAGWLENLNQAIEDNRRADLAGAREELEAMIPWDSIRREHGGASPLESPEDLLDMLRTAAQDESESDWVR